VDNCKQLKWMLHDNFIRKISCKCKERTELFYKPTSLEVIICYKLQSNHSVKREIVIQQSRATINIFTLSANYKSYEE